MDAGIYEQVLSTHRQAAECIGCEVVYHFGNGDLPLKTHIIIDQDFELRPVAYEQPVSTLVTEFLVLRSDVPYPRRGDYIVVPDVPSAIPFGGHTYDVEGAVGDGDPFDVCVRVCKRDG